MRVTNLLVFIILLLSVTSCELVGDIFSAGFYAGIFVVVAVIALIVWLVARRR